MPANHSPVLRIRGALRATAIAEGFRAEGKKVLLIMDSLTRVAHAGREIGLALGEPASARGYPPSAIAMLPSLIERAGTCVASGGSITAIYTVLADGDDGNDPVVDSARSILDGHIVLNRALAERGVYPAIDIGPSVSRVMTDIAQRPHVHAARILRRHLATYEENRDLVLMGAYRSGRGPGDRRGHRLSPRRHGLHPAGCRPGRRAGGIGPRTDRRVRRWLMPAPAGSGGCCASARCN